MVFDPALARLLGLFRNCNEALRPEVRIAKTVSSVRLVPRALRALSHKGICLVKLVHTVDSDQIRRFGIVGFLAPSKHLLDCFQSQVLLSLLDGTKLLRGEFDLVLTFVDGLVVAHARDFRGKDRILLALAQVLTLSCFVVLPPGLRLRGRERIIIHSLRTLLIVGNHQLFLGLQTISSRSLDSHRSVHHCGFAPLDEREGRSLLCRAVATLVVDIVQMLLLVRAWTWQAFLLGEGAVSRRESLLVSDFASRSHRPPSLSIPLFSCLFGVIDQGLKSPIVCRVLFHVIL